MLHRERRPSHAISLVQHARVACETDPAPRCVTGDSSWQHCMAAKYVRRDEHACMSCKSLGGLSGREGCRRYRTMNVEIPCTVYRTILGIQAGYKFAATFYADQHFSSHIEQTRLASGLSLSHVRRQRRWLRTCMFTARFRRERRRRRAASVCSALVLCSAVEHVGPLVATCSRSVCSSRRPSLKAKTCHKVQSLQTNRLVRSRRKQNRVFARQTWFNRVHYFLPRLWTPGISSSCRTAHGSGTAASLPGSCAQNIICNTAKYAF